MVFNNFNRAVVEEVEVNVSRVSKVLVSLVRVAKDLEKNRKNEVFD